MSACWRPGSDTISRYGVRYNNANSNHARICNDDAFRNSRTRPYPNVVAYENTIALYSALVKGPLPNHIRG